MLPSNIVREREKTSGPSSFFKALASVLSLKA